MSKLSAFFKSARLVEVAVMLGFPVIGLLFAFDDPAQLVSRKPLLFVIAVFALFTAIYACNGLCGIGEDSENERLADLSGKKRSFIVNLLISLLISFVCFFSIDPVLLGMAAVSMAVWTLYSFPKAGFKYRPLLGTFLHFAGEILHFLMGYIVIRKIDAGAVFASIYFALLFAAGHLNHELIDYDSDKKTGIKTGAVTFGRRNWEILSLAVTCFSTLYLGVLLLTGAVPYVAAFFAAAGVCHIAFRFLCFGREQVQRKYLAERKFYRIAYFTAGVMFVLMKIVSYE